jgi:transcriptional regulator with XRE-family HTH domain
MEGWTVERALDASTIATAAVREPPFAAHVDEATSAVLDQGKNQVPRRNAAGDPLEMRGLDARLRELRKHAGLSLRELGRQAGVSASLVSQIEHGKTRPSVSTLYTFARLFNVPLDKLFDAEQPAGTDPPAYDADRSRGHDPANVWHPSAYESRLSVMHPTHRAQLRMSEGIVWERLAATPERDVNFVKVTYAPGASSAKRTEPQQHGGYEYGFALSGSLEVTVGSEVFVLHAGESLGFDSTIPHALRNISDKDFEGIWFVHGHGH